MKNILASLCIASAVIFAGCSSNNGDVSYKGVNKLLESKSNISSAIRNDINNYLKFGKELEDKGDMEGARGMYQKAIDALNK